MTPHFMLFSDLQKKVTTSPIKTWRLLKALRDLGKMRETVDWQMRDRKLYVNVPRFIVELEAMGYTNLKSNDFTDASVKSDEITKLADEIKLLSTEITEREIQEEMQPTDFKNPEMPNEMKSDEITDEHSRPQMDGISPGMKSGEINLRFEEYKLISTEIMQSDLMKSKEAIIESKDEVIAELKQTIESKDKDITQLRTVIDAVTQQNQTLTKTNAWLTNLLTAPKANDERVKSADFIEADAAPAESDNAPATDDAPPAPEEVLDDAAEG